jgi:hypothetical protein
MVTFEMRLNFFTIMPTTMLPIDNIKSHRNGCLYFSLEHIHPVHDLLTSGDDS